MKKQFIILVFALAFNGLFAQTDSVAVSELQQKVLSIESNLNNSIQETEKLQIENATLSRSIYSLKKELNSFKASFANQIDSLNNIVENNLTNTENTANELGVKIEKSEQTTNQNISNLNESLSQKTLYWIFASLVLAVLVLVVFIILRKQIFKQKSDLINDIQSTRKSLEEEGVKLDNKLIEVLEKQLKIINSSNSSTEKEADHTLAIKVADEIIRMQTNMSLMDKDIKGLKKLESAVKRIQDNFASNGYELVEMLGKPYNEGMKVTIVSSKPDENLKSGEQVISRIIKPQINYNDEMIQSAQIEVSQGE